MTTPPPVASGVAVIRDATTGRFTLVWPDDQPPVCIIERRLLERIIRDLNRPNGH